MAKRVLSIVIGSECTKVCEVSYKKDYKNKGIKVYRSISFPTPKDVIEDGYIKDMNAFGEELRLQLKAFKCKADKVIFSVSSSKIANREVIIPPVKEKRIMDIIKTGAAEYFPIDMKDYILSYQILEKNVSKRQEKANKKQLSKTEKKLAREQAKQDKKARKKKSKTELIADEMEQMEAKLNEQASEEFIQDTEQKSTDIAKKQMRISVFAAPSTLVKNYYSFAKMMHFEIIAIDYYGNSSYQTIKRQVKRGTNVFVQMNEQDTLISILRDDVLILQRTVGYGISDLIEAVMEQDYYKVSNAKEAMELLECRNLFSSENTDKGAIPFDTSLAKGEAAAASDAAGSFGFTRRRSQEAEQEAKRYIRESLHFLTNSIARLLDYYKSNHKRIDIDTIYLTGAGVHIQGIEQFFTSEIGLTHRKMEKLYMVSSQKKAIAFRSNPGEFITCIGAVIKPVDFIPYEFVLKKQKRSAIIGTIIFTMACLAGSAGTIYIAYTDYQIARLELQEAENILQSKPPLSSVHTEYDTAVKELEDLQKLEVMTGSNNDYIKDVINEMEKKLPSGTVIHTILFNDKGVTMSVTANDDSAGSNALVAKTIKQLKDIPYFKDNVNPSGISVKQENGVNKVSFTITCTYVEQ